MAGTPDTPLPETLEPVALATTPEMARAYAALTGDFNPIHLDPGFAASTPFGQPIAHGTMVLNLILLAATRTFGAARVPGALSVRFVRPVPVGATVRAGGSLAEAASATYEVFVDTDAGVRAIEGTLSVRPARP